MNGILQPRRMAPQPRSFRLLMWKLGLTRGWLSFRYLPLAPQARILPTITIEFCVYRVTYTKFTHNIYICMYLICTSVYIFRYIYMYTYNIYIYIYTHTYVNTHVFLFVYLLIYLST